MGRRIVIAVWAALAAGCSQDVPETHVLSAVAPERPGAVSAAFGERVVTVAAFGEAAASTWPRFQVIADGELLGEAEALGGSLRHYKFPLRQDPGTVRQVVVRYLNDAVMDVGHREDRNLFVPYLAVGGRTLRPMADATYRREDGRQERGSERMYWSGDLVFAVGPS